VSNLKKLSLALTATIFAAPALAQTTVLPDVVISANQTPQPADRVGASVTVLQGTELRARGVETVADALRTVPGVHVSAAGNKGTLTQVRIRGGEANHLQVLIDDIPVGRLDGGDYDFADMLVDDIERIEVVRGPQSGIYGGNAASGVISIYTKSGRGLKKPELTARAEVGTQNSSLFSTTVRSAQGPFYSAFTVQTRDTNGYNISRFGNEKDGNRTFNFNAKAGVDVSETLNIEGVVRYTDRKVQYDAEFAIPLPDNFAQDINKHSNARINVNHRSLDGNFTQRLGFFTRDEDYLLSFGNSYAKAHGGDYKASYNFVTGSLAHTATGLIDWKNEKYENFGVAERQRTGVAYEHVTVFPFGLTLSGAVRQDFHDVFQDYTTYRIAASQTLSTGTRLHSSYGTGISLPTFYEQFGFGLNFIGNPALKPETTKGWDFGVEQTLFRGMLVLDATYFSLEIDNRISGNGMTAINNAGISASHGVELTAKFKPAAWLMLDGNYTYTDTEAPDGRDLIRRPKNSGSFTATVLSPDNKTRASVTVVHNGKMADDAFFGFPATRVTLDSYTLVNAIISYQYNVNTQFYIRGENLLNERYEEIFSYRGNGATAYVGMRMKFGELASQIVY
jgi:vitamin B12 transporter